MQQDFERRGERGRGGFNQRGDDRDYERIYDNYGESSGEFDARERRSQGYSGADRGRYGERQRQDRYSDDMRGYPNDRERFQQERFEQGRYDQPRRQGSGSRSSYEAEHWGDRGGRRMSDRGYDDYRSSRSGGYDQRGGRFDSPYDQGEIGSWYGGDSGMGDPGSSLTGRQYGQDRYDWGQRDRGQLGRQRAGWDEPSRRQASSQYGSREERQHRFDEEHFTDRFGADRFAEPLGWRRGPAAGYRDDAMEGPFTGRGPRGYHRSDERIYEDVCELLTRHGDIDASQMEVEVHNGVVTLRGTADSGYVRRLTEEVVEGVMGVRDVRNDLRVNQRTGYAEAMPSDMRQPDTQRSELAHHDWERGDAGRLDAGRTETGAFAMGSSGTTTGQTQQPQTGGSQTGGAQTGGRSSIRETMDVVGSDGVVIGRVKETRSNDFLVDRSMQRDVYVPFSAVQTVDGERVMLRIAARDVDQQGWESPDLAETSQQTTSRS